MTASLPAVRPERVQPEVIHYSIGIYFILYDVLACCV